jgi:hypothetical protein
MQRNLNMCGLVSGLCVYLIVFGAYGGQVSKVVATQEDVVQVVGVQQHNQVAFEFVRRGESGEKPVQRSWVPGVPGAKSGSGLPWDINAHYLFYLSQITMPPTTVWDIKRIPLENAKNTDAILDRRLKEAHSRGAAGISTGDALSLERLAVEPLSLYSLAWTAALHASSAPPQIRYGFCAISDSSVLLALHTSGTLTLWAGFFMDASAAERQKFAHGRKLRENKPWIRLKAVKLNLSEDFELILDNEQVSLVTADGKLVDLGKIGAGSMPPEDEIALVKTNGESKLLSFDQQSWQNIYTPEQRENARVETLDSGPVETFVVDKALKRTVILNANKKIDLFQGAVKAVHPRLPMARTAQPGGGLKPILEELPSLTAGK